MPLEEIAKLFEIGIRVRDQRYQLVAFKDIFMGSNTVDVLVESRIAGRVKATCHD